MNLTFKITTNYSYGETCLLNNEPLVDTGCLFTVSDVATYEKSYNIELSLPLDCNISVFLDSIFCSIRDVNPATGQNINLKKRFTRTSLESYNRVVGFIQSEGTVLPDICFQKPSDYPVFLCTTKPQAEGFNAPDPVFNSLNKQMQELFLNRRHQNNGTVNLIGMVGDDFEYIDYAYNYFCENNFCIELVFANMGNNDVRYYKIELDTVASAAAIIFLTSTFEYINN